jgi:hypothetical protein
MTIDGTNVTLSPLRKSAGPATAKSNRKAKSALPEHARP